MLKKEVRSLTKYIVIPQRRGKSQRITLPIDLLRSKEWLKTDCYMIEDNGEDEVIIRTYSEYLKEHYEHPQPQTWD